MSGRIGPDAFSLYVSLGENRTYQRVAEHFGVSKRAVCKAASRENWTPRLKAIEDAARARADEKLTETMEEVRSRHQKLLRAMSARAAKALAEYPLRNGMEALRAAEMVIKLERLVYGEATSNTSVSVEQVTRREIDSLLAVEEKAEEQEGEDEW